MNENYTQTLYVNESHFEQNTAGPRVTFEQDIATTNSIYLNGGHNATFVNSTLTHHRGLLHEDVDSYAPIFDEYFHADFYRYS